MGRSTHAMVAALVATAGLFALGSVSPSSASTVPAISVGDASAVEGDTGLRTVYFPVTLSRPATSPTTVNYRLVAVSATAGTAKVPGSDFDAKAGKVRTLTFRSGTVAKYVGANVFPDAADEGDETFAIELSTPSAGYGLGRAAGTGTVVDDDAVMKTGVQLRVGDAAIDEGDVTKRVVKFAVTLSAPAASEVRVGYRIVDGTADCGPLKAGVGLTPDTDCDDRKGVTRTLKFPVGRTGTTPVKKVVSVTVLPDAVDVGDETFTVELSNPVGAALPDPTATGTILDDDASVAPSMTSLTASANPSAEGAPLTLTATVTGSGAPTGTVEFFDGTTSLGTGTLLGGAATVVTDSLPAGVRSLTATYQGDANFAASVSAPLAVTIDPPLGPAAKVDAVAGSGAHTCALLEDGRVRCWGFGHDGQLGLGRTDDLGDEPGEMGDNIPPVDLGAGRTATQIAVDAAHSCALLDDGTVKCWGNNAVGQLGQGDPTSRGDDAGEMGDALAPVALGAGRTATAISAGDSHTCALLDDGSVRCWGRGTEGQLGLGFAANVGDQHSEMGDALPAVALGTGRTAVAIDAGGNHTCAVLDDGSLKCWGWNVTGQLGLGDSTARGDQAGEMGDALPAVSLGSGRTAVSVSAGAFQTCAVLDDGSVKCWGKNVTGELGQGNTTQLGDGPGEMGDALPAVALGTGRAATAVSTATGHTCAVLDEGSLKCWGQNNNGQLGLGDSLSRGTQSGQMGNNLPAVSLGAGRTADRVDAGGNATCAVRDDGSLTCWGQNNRGQLGRGDTETIGDNSGEMGDALTPVRVATAVPASGVVQIAVASGFSCALRMDGNVKCWGENYAGQLGQGDTLNRGDGPGQMGNALLPVSLGAGRTATQIAAGFRHACVILDDGSVKCWGENAYGQLGQGDTLTRGDGPGEMGDALPPIALGAGRTARQISAGAYHSCAILDDGTVKCWGYNSDGQLGRGDTVPRGDELGEMGDALTPIPLGSARTATQLSSGSYHSCAVLDDQSLKCWGQNAYGQLGLGDAANRGDGPNEMGDALPTVALGAGRTVAQVSGGFIQSCALLDDGNVKCWGVGLRGVLGQGDIATRGDGPGEMGDALPPIALGAGRIAVQVSAGTSHGCALLDDRSVKCWGSNNFAQLGLGDRVNRGDDPGEMGDHLPPVALGTDRTAVQVGAGTYHSCGLFDDGSVKCWGWNDVGLLGQGDRVNRGDQPGEMGDDLPPIDLGS